jgi:hypothetical protein
VSALTPAGRSGLAGRGRLAGEAREIGRGSTSAVGLLAQEIPPEHHTAALLGTGDLARRLEALAALTRIGAGRDGFDADLIADSETLLLRANERLRLSAGHTVVALAGGTGSGKSTLFNALAGASFSPPGVIRPTTRDVHACVWGMEAAAPLLDWLGVPRRHRYARASVLDSGEATLHGLILLDLPDHDSVIESSSEAVDRISKLADMLVWVLDPQKYADAAVHNRYLVPLARHAGVFTVVLSQADLLTAKEADDCAEDLRRLLDSEGLESTRLCVVSARSGAGLDEVRELLSGAVSASRAASERISADIDALLGRYEAYAAGPAIPLPQGQGDGRDEGSRPDAAGLRPESGDPGREALGDTPVAGPDVPVAADVESGLDTSPEPAEAAKPPAKPPWELSEEELAEFRAEQDRPPWEDATRHDEQQGQHPAELARNVPERPAAELTGAFVGASGLIAVADGMATTREARAARLTSWPVARVLRLPGATRSDGRQASGVGAGGADGAGPGGAGSRGTGPGGTGSGGAGSQGAGSGNGAGAAAGRGAMAGLAPQSEVDNAINALADAVGGRLPEPWPAAVRRAARSRADEVPPALADAVRLGDPGPEAAPLRWRLIAVWQWALLVLAVVALIWIAVVAAAHGPNRPALVSDLSLLPWLAVLAVALLLLGALTSVGCQNMAANAADRERERAERAMREQVEVVARGLVLAPVGHEMGTYERFRRELAVARGSGSRWDSGSGSGSHSAETGPSQ